VSTVVFFPISSYLNVGGLLTWWSLQGGWVIIVHHWGADSSWAVDRPPRTDLRGPPSRGEESTDTVMITDGRASPVTTLRLDSRLPGAPSSATTANSARAKAASPLFEGELLI
jgi:hypothetical protein